MNRYLVFYGTLTTIVQADHEDAAFEVFSKSFGIPRFWRGKPQPARADVGRVMPPAREEVTIRLPLTSDRGWIEDSGDPAFLALLGELADA